jgi:hypothetical protein
LFTGIYAPQDAPAWSSDREKLWNSVEHSERRKDAQVARDYKIALPCELTPEQNRWLVQDFVRENFTRKGYVADVAIHAPDAHGDDRNIHAHIMVTMRTLGAEVSPRRRSPMNDMSNIFTPVMNNQSPLERHGHGRKLTGEPGSAGHRAPGLHGQDATAACAGITTERRTPASYHDRPQSEGFKRTRGGSSKSMAAS